MVWDPGKFLQRFTSDPGGFTLLRSVWLCVLVGITIVHCALKTLDTISDCQRPVSSLGVSQHMHKTTNLWVFELNRSSNLRDDNERKYTLVTRNCVR